MLRGFARKVAPTIDRCELTFIDRIPIDYNVAVQQHTEYCQLLRRCGAALKILESDEAYPDCCFVEDKAIVLDEVAIITSMGSEARRGEETVIKEELSRFRKTIRIEFPAVVEGGDVLRVGRNIFVGLSTRTNALGVEELRRTLEPLSYQISTVVVKDSLHLKTACSAIDDESLLLNPNWISRDAFGKFRLLYTPDDEPWGANLLRVGDTVCLPAGFPRTAERVGTAHDKLTILDVSEFQKAEAGLTCLSILFDDKPANKFSKDAPTLALG